MTRIARPEKPSRAERLYARWLRLYPSEHRRAYGPLILQAFRDSYRDARDTRGKVAADFWLAVVGDAVISLAREYDVVIRETGKRLKYRALAIASGVLLSGSVFVYVIECVR